MRRQQLAILAVVTSMAALTTASAQAQFVSNADKQRMEELQRQLDRPINSSRIEIQARQAALTEGATLPEVQNLRKSLQAAKDTKDVASVAAISAQLNAILEKLMAIKRSELLKIEEQADERIRKEMAETSARIKVGMEAKAVSDAAKAERDAMMAELNLREREIMALEGINESLRADPLLKLRKQYGR